MKTLPLVLAVATTFLGASALRAQTTVTTRNANGRKTTTTFTSRRARNYEHNTGTPIAPVAIGPRTDGVIPRAIRSGNALQMVNPAAPAEFGNGQDVTRHEAEDPFQRPQGIKLYAIEF